MYFNRAFIIVSSLLIFLIIVNLVFINIKLFQSESSLIKTPTITPTPTTEVICYEDCIEEFSRKITSLEAAITALPTPQTTVVQKTNTVTENAKEFFIPMGNGSSTSTTWTNVAGISAYIDPRNYNNIKAIYFEVNIDVPTDNQSVSVRLYQNNEGYPVWNSELQYSGSSAQLLISSPLTLESGNKLYTVQVKTQLGYTATITQARVRVVTH